MEEKALSPKAITDNLPTHFIGQKVVYYSSVTSTNALAKQEARWGAPAGTVVVADEQKAGRGRLNRVWLSPKGGVALSVILRPNIVFLPRLIMLASLAVVSAIENVTGFKADIKWPNDVLLGGKKVCGILIENEIRKSALVYAVIGIGINVNMHLGDFPEVSSIATSLSDEIGEEVSRVELVRQVLVEMDELYVDLPDGDVIYQRWRDRLVTLDKTVRVQQGETAIEGLAESADRDGSLLVRQQDGSLTRIVAGDATTLRS